MDKSLKYIKEGMLQEKRRQAESLETKADRLYRDITVYLFSSDGIKGMEFVKAKQAFEELTQVVGEFGKTTEEIKRIEGEL